MIRLFSAGGIGDQLQVFQCIEFLKIAGESYQVFSCSRDEVFSCLKYLYPDENIIQIREGLGAEFEKNADLFRQYNEGIEAYLVWPDLLFSHPLSFDYRKFNTHPQSISLVRTLLGDYKPKKRIYLGLLSNTAGYTYMNIGELAVKLALSTDYEVYLPILTRWANKDIPPVILKGELPKNLIIDQEPSLLNSINILKSSEYCICTDNGISHISFHLGQKRLLLDPRAFTQNSLPWISRWRQNLSDSVPIYANVNNICDIVKSNITIEQTNLIPKGVVSNIAPSKDWDDILLIKH